MQRVLRFRPRLVLPVLLTFLSYPGKRDIIANSHSREALTVGFDVILGDGRQARVPAGKFRFSGTMEQAIDLDNPRLEAHLASVLAAGPSRALAQLDRPWTGDRQAFRYNVVREAVMMSGDPVVLLSHFEPAVNPIAETPIYRDPARTILVPKGPGGAADAVTVWW